MKKISPKETFRKREIFKVTSRPEKSTALKLNFRPWRGILYLLILVGFVYLIFFSSVFKIKNIDIEGVKSVEIADYLHQSLIGKNIIIFSPSRYLSRLSAKFPILEEARLVRGLPNTIRVIVNERKQVLIWCAQECYDLDAKGYAYQKVDKPSDKIVLIDESNLKIEQGQQVASEQFVKFFLNAIERTEQMNLKITEAKIGQTTYRLSFKTSEGWSIIFDTSGSLKNQINALKQVLEKNRDAIHEYVDVRVEGTVFIK